MKPILEIQDISKKFRIQHQLSQYLSMRDRLVDLMKFKRTSSSEVFWALQNVSFNVEQGASVGIIGKNGAGKSTLLKILSKITPPTSGQIVARGHIASLLEVGTGFHAELSGRENIFFNGSILGMKRREIIRKFDEIVEFSGVSKFLDTPIKRYSSGMQLRLAFSVAAFLDPEIMIIDEVLAVGDTEFQKKCLGKMDEVSKSGRTVIFVSHNLGMMAQLCKQSICLYKGNIVAEGKTENVINYYLSQNNDQATRIEGDPSKEGNKFMLLCMTDTQSTTRTEYRFDEDITVAVELYFPVFRNDFELAMRLDKNYGTPVFTIHEKLEQHYQGGHTIKLNIVIPSKFITPGKYSWVMCINQLGVKLHDLRNNILPFLVLDTGSDFLKYDGSDYGSVFAKYTVQNVTG